MQLALQSLIKIPSPVSGSEQTEQTEQPCRVAQQHQHNNRTDDEDYIRAAAHGGKPSTVVFVNGRGRPQKRSLSE